MTRDPMHTSVCDRCYRGTWYTGGEMCRMSRPTRCKCCGQTTGEEPCGGTLRAIDRSALAPAFARYHESGERIRVRFADGREATGTIGKSTGWRPVYLLMPRVDSIASSDTLGAGDRVVAVRRDPDTRDRMGRAKAGRYVHV